jgi:hypothetical protein
MTENINSIKDINTIKDYWNNRPCNLNHSTKEVGSKEA